MIHLCPQMLVFKVSGRHLCFQCEYLRLVIFVCYFVWGTCHIETSLLICRASYNRFTFNHVWFNHCYDNGGIIEKEYNREGDTTLFPFWDLYFFCNFVYIVMNSQWFSDFAISYFWNCQEAERRETKKPDNATISFISNFFKLLEIKK